MGSMPTKPRGPVAVPSVQVARADTFETRKAIAKPGDMFVGPNGEAVVFVLGIEEPGKLGYLWVDLQGSRVSWVVNSWETLTLPDTWKLHNGSNVNFEPGTER